MKAIKPREKSVLLFDVFSLCGKNLTFLRALDILYPRDGG